MSEKCYGLLGRRLGHSWSVPIHKALGRGGYRLFELEPEQLGDFLRREDVGGLNVTIPYKRDVMRFCDAIDPAAEAIGSVNTLVRREGKLAGYNTDIDGFLYMLRRAGISLKGKNVVILGSGGASLTAQAAAKREGAREIAVVSRSGPDNYETLPDRHGGAEVLINTTPVGMWPHVEGQPVDLRLLPNISAVADVVYNPGRTNLLLQAEELFFDKTIPDSETENIVTRLWQDRTNLVLVGMPGCGKTTVGRALAQLSGKPFVDLDEEIVRRAGRPIPYIFQTEGEEAFRELEARVLAEVCAQSGQVVATGGGAVLRAENRAAMRRTGRVYWLRRDLNVLPKEGRPLSQKGSLEEMYQMRKPLYEAAADFRVDNNQTAAEAAQQIWSELCANIGN